MNKSSCYFIVLLLIVYVPIAYYGIQVMRPASDENVYFYQAKLLLEGNIPYKDFFLSHPPVFIYVTALALKIFGVNYLALKLIPLASAFIVLYVTYLLGEKFKQGIGVYACILTLAFSEHFHHVSHINLGLMLTTALTLTAYYLHATNKRLHSGFVIALALYTRLNSLPILAYLAIRSYIEKDKKFFKGIILTAPLLIIFITPNFIEDVILYRLKEDPAAVSARLTSTYKFLLGELPLIILTLLFMEELFKSNEMNIKRIIRGWIRGDGEMNLVALPIFFLVFTLILQRRIYPTYFTLIIPYLAVSAAIGLRMITRTAGFARTAAYFILIAYFTYFSVSIAESAYTSYDLTVLEKASVYVSENTEPGEKVLFMQYVGGPKIALETNTQIADNIIAPTTHLVYAYKDTINESLLKALEENPVLVSLELRMLQEMTNMGVGVSQVMDYLRQHYWPTHVVLGEKTVDTLVFWKLKERMNYSEGEYPEPGKISKTHYMERYIVTVNGEEIVEDSIFEGDVAASKPIIPPQLTGENISEVALIVKEELIKWPLKETTHYFIEGGENTSSEVWVATIKDDIMEIMVFTWWEDSGRENLLSLTVIRYDTVNQVFVNLACYSRISIPLSDFYKQIYQQILVSEQQYEKLGRLIEGRYRGEVGVSEYRNNLTAILSGR